MKHFETKKAQEYFEATLFMLSTGPVRDKRKALASGVRP
jgi:hypothetical protein